MANEAEQAIYQRLASAPLFHPASVELLPEDWGIETGDVVSVKSGNETYNVPVYSHTLVWNGKSKATIESTGNQQREPLPELKRKEYQQGHAMYSGFRAQQQEIDEHYQHVVEVTDQGMSDAFGILGVSIGADGMPAKDSSGNYIWDDSGTGGEIWGHLNRSAWTSVIQNHIQDANGNILSIAKVLTNADGQALIQAINDQQTGTATINADRIRIGTTGGASVTLGDRVTITSNGYTKLNGTTVADALRVDMQGGGAGFYTDGDNIQLTAETKAASLYVPTTGGGWNAVVNAISAIAMSSSSGVISLTPTYLDGATGTPVNFNIAATQYFLDTLAKVSFPSTPRTSANFEVAAPGPVDANNAVTTIRKYFYLGESSVWDSNHTKTIDVTMKHNEGGTAVTDGVVATMNVDASDVFASVTLSQAPPVNGVVRVSATNGEYEDVVFRTADEVSKITLLSSDTGADISKTVTVGYDNGDTTANVPVSVDASAVYDAGKDAAAASLELTDGYQDLTDEDITVAYNRSRDVIARVPNSDGTYTEKKAVFYGPTSWINLTSGQIYGYGFGPDNGVRVSNSAYDNGTGAVTPGTNYVWLQGTDGGWAVARSFNASDSTPSIGTPYINNPNAGYIRAAVTVNGVTYYGDSVKLTNDKISGWGGPV